MDGYLRAWDQDRAPGPEVSPEKAAAWVTGAVTVHGAGSSDGDFRPVIWASTASVT